MSTLKVTNIESPSGGGVNAKITDINGGQLGNRNLIINGAMRVAQRGTSSVTSGFSTVDRIEGGFTGGAVTQSQGTLTTGAGDSTVYDLGFRHYFRQTNTTAVSDTAAHHRNIRYRVEAQDLATSGWDYTNSSSYITFSFYVRSSVAQQFYAYIRTENGTERIYPFSTGSLSADTWTKVEKTIPRDSSLTIPNDNSSGVQIFVVPFWGTNFTDSSVSLNAWSNYASGSRAPDYATTWATTASATFDITGLQLEVGEVATAFEHRSYGDELARCQRYYFRLTTTSGDQSVAAGYNQNSNATRHLVHFPVTMRARATALEQSGTASDYSLLHGTSITVCTSAPAFNSCTENTAEVQATATGSITAGQGSLLTMETTGFLAWSAEL